MAGVNRFNFLQRQEQNTGWPAGYDVQDFGCGQVIGQVLYDFVMARWSFVLTAPRHAHLGLASADTTQISNFINGLALPANPPNPVS